MEKTKYTIAASMIKEFEVFKSKAYICPAGVRTIGYGRTTGSFEPTTPEAESIWLMERLVKTNKLLNDYVKPSQTPAQMAALMSLVYNIGDSAFIKSTLLKTLNSNSSRRAIEFQWIRWNKGGGLVLPGLIRRRKAELEIYFS
jgi:lysozyme